MTWNQIRAAIYGKPLKISNTPPTLGPLIPVILNIGLYNNISELEKQMLRCETQIYPDTKLIKKYEERKQSFMKQWSHLKQFYDI